MKREEALTMANELKLGLFECWHDGADKGGPEIVADLILEVERQTAARCAEIVRDGEVIDTGSGYLRYESGSLTLEAAAGEIGAAFGLEPRR